MIPPEKDRIAVAGMTVSRSAVILQMPAASEFAIDQRTKLDALTVGHSVMF